MAAPALPKPPPAPTYQPDEATKKMRTQFFDQKRAEGAQAVNSQAQQGDDAIQRRFAAMGAQGSGAQIAAMQKNRDAAMDAGRKSLTDVAGQELQANEADVGRSFQSAEAGVGRQFQSSEADLARKFQSTESEAQRAFQGSLAEKDMALKQKLADTDQTNKLAELDLARQQFALDKDTTAFNQRMAEIEAGRTPEKSLITKITDIPGNIVGGVGSNAGSIAGGLAGGAALGPVGNVVGAIAGGGGCFLTTACVEVMGLNDECWVLTLARSFRDSYMSATKDRAQEIKDYYEYAPKIVEAINRREDSERIWKRLFWQDVVPFAIEVGTENLESSHELYKKMILRAKMFAAMEA